MGVALQARINPPHPLHKCVPAEGSHDKFKTESAGRIKKAPA